MPIPKVVPAISSGRFSSRVSKGFGGNKDSGPFHEFPIDLAVKRHYVEIFNDFLSLADFDVQNFEWNRNDGSASAYAAGTAVARVPDWVVAEIGAGSTDPLVNTTAFLLADQPYGVLRVDAGGTDSTGSRISRPRAAANQAELINITTTNQVAGEFRFRFTETGTATQSAFNLGWCIDDAATMSTAGVLTGGVAHFGVVKSLATAEMLFYIRATATTTSTVSLGNVISGTWYTVGWRSFRGVSTAAGNSNIDVWKDGVFLGTASNSATTSALTASSYAPMASAVNGVGADCTLDIDYYSAIQARD